MPGNRYIEIKRTPKKNLKKYPPDRDWKKGKFARLDHHLYAPTEGDEKDIIHYFFSEDELKKILSDFSFTRMEEDEKGRHYCLVDFQNKISR
jgi:hypothetical protein